MKKQFKKLAFLAAIAMVSGICFMNSQKSETLSEVVLANVEALADVEIDMRRGYSLSVKSATCFVCEWTGIENDYCNVHSQLPDC